MVGWGRALDESMCCFVEWGLISRKLDIGYESFGVDRPNAGFPEDILFTSQSGTCFGC